MMSRPASGAAGSVLQPQLGVERGVVVALDDEPAFVQVRKGGRLAPPTRAEIAIVGYRPTSGDHVLLTASGDDWFVVGVLGHPTVAGERPGVTTLPGGDVVQTEGAAVEIRDAQGRLRVRYEDGSADVYAPAGDLTLAAPAGRLVLRAGQDVELTAARDITQHAARSVAVGAGNGTPQVRIEGERATVSVKRLDVSAFAARWTAERGEILVRDISIRAGSLHQHVERVEITAKRLVERTVDVVRETSELLETRAGRVRNLVTDLYTHYAKRTAIVSEEETTIDGKRIHLG